MEQHRDIMEVPQLRRPIHSLQSVEGQRQGIVFQRAVQNEQRSFFKRPRRQGSFSTPCYRIFLISNRLRPQEMGVAPGAGSPSLAEICRTTGGTATPAAWNTHPHTPWASLRNKNRFPSCSTSTTRRRSTSWITSAHSRSCPCLAKRASNS